jgi:hypothetical protein
VDAVTETGSLTGSPLGGLEESFPEGYFSSIHTRFSAANKKYRATAKYRATRAARAKLHPDLRVSAKYRAAK